MEKLDGGSLDLEKANLEKLQSVFPDCVSEGKLDLTKLLALLGQYDDNDFEKYKFEWKGKNESLRLAQQRSMGTLRPCPEESVDWDTTQNLYIEGDNLEVLKLLQTAYYRKVKMIYIDPPYNTGNDFVYEDDFADPIAKYKEVTAQTTQSNPETMGRYHTNWLNMIYPRLRLAANLLTDDGVIFISIDDNEVHNLRKVCDEVFGEENFVSQVIWERAYAPVNLKKHFSESHDFILCYAKKLDVLSCNGLKRSEDANDRYSNPDNDPRGLWTSGDLSVGPAIEDKIYEIITPSGRKVLPPSGYCWRYSKEKFEEALLDNRIWFGVEGNNVPRIKRFLSDVKEGITPMTIWKHPDVGHSQSAAQNLKKLFDNKAFFDYPKPVDLIKRCIDLYTNSDSVILDFFSGSGTTAHAVMQLNKEDGGNRKFIMVQLPEVTDEKSEAYKAGYKNICEIGKERIRRAGTALMDNEQLISYNEKKSQTENTNDGQLFADEELDNNSPLSIIHSTLENSPLSTVNNKLDKGFKVFKLDTFNLKTWDPTLVDSDDGQQIDMFIERLNDMNDTIKADRTDMDMVYEIMLKMGVPPTYPVSRVKINGKTAYSVGEEYLLLICLQDGLTAETIERMAEDYLPSKMILSEKCFADDTAMANAHYILKEHEIELKLV